MNQLMIRHFDGRIPERHDGIPDELVYGAVLIQYFRTQLVKQPIKKGNKFSGFDLFAHPCEIQHVAEHDRHRLDLAAQL